MTETPQISDVSESDVPKDDGVHVDGDPVDGDNRGGTDSGEVAEESRASTRVNRWWLLLLVALVVEFWVYGRRGEIDVCVGKQGAHDFALIGQERTDANRWSHPRCESAVNLGLRSHYEAAVEEAATAACRGQTMLRHRGEGAACVAQEDGWQRQVQTGFIPPWDRRYYQHLLWFLF